MAGYSSTPLPKKLGIKEQSRLAFVNAPTGFADYLGPLPESAEVVKRLTKPLDLVLLFVTTERALAKLCKNFGEARNEWNDLDRMAEEEFRSRYRSLIRTRATHRSRRRPRGRQDLCD